MKNKLTKISAALSFSIIILLMMGCPPKKQTDQSGKKPPIDTTNKTAMKDTSLLRLKNLLSNYKNHFNMQLTSYDDSISYIDSIIEIETPWFDCNMSNHTLREHILNYNDAFAYILHFQDKYSILASAEIPVTPMNPFRNTRHTDPEAADNCGLLMYLGIDGSNMFTIAYHTEANVVSDASRLFPRTSTAYEYFRAECQNTNRTPIPDPNDLNAEVTRYAKVCPWASPTPTYTNDQIKNYGFELIRQLAVLQPPIAFFHAEEIKDLISQNDADPDVTSHCTGIRLYYGYDDDDANPIKIKLIGFAIDGSGKNILYKYDGSPAMMIERSWPPDFY